MGELVDIDTDFFIFDRVNLYESKEYPSYYMMLHIHAKQDLWYERFNRIGQYSDTSRPFIYPMVKVKMPVSVHFNDQSQCYLFMNYLKENFVTDIIDDEEYQKMGLFQFSDFNPIMWKKNFLKTLNVKTPKDESPKQLSLF